MGVTRAVALRRCVACLFTTFISLFASEYDFGRRALASVKLQFRNSRPAISRRSWKARGRSEPRLDPRVSANSGKSTATWRKESDAMDVDRPQGLELKLEECDCMLSAKLCPPSRSCSHLRSRLYCYLQYRWPFVGVLARAGHWSLQLVLIGLRELQPVRFNVEQMGWRQGNWAVFCTIWTASRSAVLGQFGPGQDMLRSEWWICVYCDNRRDCRVWCPSHGCAEKVVV